MFKNATYLSFYFADNQLFSNSETLDIKNRVKFINYNFVSDLHTKMFELEKIGQL